MLRADVSGAFDFSRFDPWDFWAWRKLRWVLKEVGDRDDRDLMQRQAMYWATLAANPRVKEEAYETFRGNAGSALNKVLRLSYPWFAEQIGEVGAQTAREQAVADYHEMVGRPGEPRYEAMVDALTKEFARGKLTQRQKEQDRAARRARREARKAAAARM